jgi:type IV pilus assembly protein PilE
MHTSRSLRVARPESRGLTLIELMIVVAVVAILAALALPSYFDSVRKGRRSEAVAALAQVQQAQERWRANNALYADNDHLSNTWPAGLGIGATTSGGLYTLRIDAPVDPSLRATGYTLSATAVSGTSQANDTNCSTMRVRLANGNLSYGGCGGCAAPADNIALPDPHRCWSR